MACSTASTVWPLLYLLAKVGQSLSPYTASNSPVKTNRVIVTVQTWLSDWGNRQVEMAVNTMAKRDQWRTTWLSPERCLLQADFLHARAQLERDTLPYVLSVKTLTGLSLRQIALAANDTARRVSGIECLFCHSGQTNSTSSKLSETFTIFKRTTRSLAFT